MSTNRRGFTLTELLVGMVIMGVIGVALTRLFMSQSRFYDLQTQMRRARFVTRTAINAALSDLRMVEATGGVVSATTKQITVRAPYAMGIVCASGPTQTTLSLWPVDSTMYANAGFGGYAWRDSLGNETYVETGASVVAGAAALCTAAGVTVLAGGRVVAVQPPLPAALPAVTAVGTPIFLVQRLTYEFKASTALPGRTALWRTVTATGQSDELVAPFDSTASFGFFTAGSDTAQTTAPVPVTAIRGLQLNLAGQSERAPEGSSTPRRALAVTAVFFNNQIK